MLPFKTFKLTKEHIIFVIGDGGIIKNVIVIAMLVQRIAQLSDSLCVVHLLLLICLN